MSLYMPKLSACFLGIVMSRASLLEVTLRCLLFEFKLTLVDFFVFNSKLTPIDLFTFESSLTLTWRDRFEGAALILPVNPASLLLNSILLALLLLILKLNDPFLVMKQKLSLGSGIRNRLLVTTSSFSLFLDKATSLVKSSSLEEYSRKTSLSLLGLNFLSEVKNLW